uniref:Collagen, type VI, alpha 3 n=1 Tax=Mastacembelus armatus TaxID=205130 RepID=A0A7N8YAE4_9TELE
MRDFVQSVVQTLSVDDSKDRVSVVQYSREPAVQFYLNTYTTQGEILDSVRGLRHKGGRPLNTGAALQYLSDNVFTVSAGSRRLEGVPQVLILLSGGRSADNVDAQAAALKQLGVLTFAIGTRNSDKFKNLARLMVSSQVYFKCSQLLFSCLFSVDTAKKDIVFLLDGSDGTRNGFPAMLDFVERTLSVDDSKDRVSVVQYSREPAVQFYLNTYTTQGEILDSVRGLRHKGGRPLNTGAALQYLSDNVFTVSAGSRRLEGVPQVLILLSGGRSADNVDAQAAALKQLGVLTFAIGTRNSDSKELQKIAHSPTYALSVSEFNDLPSVRHLLKSTPDIFFMEITPESPTIPVDTAKKDIVFLLDGSDGTRNGFPAMLDFVERVVEKLNVGENKDRVSVVQYSIDAEAHFYLNTYTTKDDIVGSVRGLRHRGGRAPNTGAALQYVRDNVLTSSAGSRHLQGVPQILILLNGGRSSDNVDTPASTLKQLGVLTFAIGTRGSDSAELQRLSSDPSHALSVSDFTDLPSVQEQLSSLNMSQTLYFLAEKKPAGRDFVFLLDGSDATRSGFPAMRDFVQSVVQTLSVDDSKDRVSVVQYSREPAVQFYLNTYTTQGEILDSVRGLRHKGGRPLNTGAALQYLSDNVFTVSAGSRRLEGVPQVLILLSGGRSADNVDAQAAALKQLGVLTFAIGTRNSDSKELQKIAHSPTYVYFKCSQLLFSCLFSVDTAKKDIVFLLDGSDGTRNGFPAMLDFVERVVEKLNVGENKDRVSVVQYSIDAEAHFYLNTYTTKDDIVGSVRGLRHRGGRAPNTGAALQYVRDNVLTSSAGSRHLQGVPQILILLNGGRSSDNVDTPASTLKQLGVLTFAIGTRGSDSAELQRLSSDPSHALSVSDFTDLPSLNMSQTLYFLAEKKPAGRDFVFLLDGSDATRSGFPAMRDFVQSVVQALSVDDSKNRVSVVQYSREPAVQFYLNTYMTQGEILDSVRGLRHKGGRPLNTGAALQYLSDNVFTVSAGSRRLEGVPQVLILLSGGRSADNVDTPASALKQLGVLTFAIGTRGSDSAELQRLSSDPSHALSVSDFTDLPSVQEQLSSVMSRLNMSQTLYFLAEKKPAGRDFVFLLDGSDATRSGFPAMRDFVQSVVQTLSVDDSKDRVSVVQYSREPAVQFYLNTYTTQGEILDSVRGLRHRGGRPLNTGAALQYLSDNVFTVSAGSRRLEGVPQVLILLSGGRSADNVDAQAAALKQLGVLTFAIGTRNSDSKELQKIAHSPTYALSVSEFNDLPSLSSVMSRVLVRSTPRTPTLNMPQTLYFLAEKKPAGRDFVFLLDGSDATRSGFPAMRDFVQSVVQTLSVDDSKDRVSVVQYSREPAVQFYLNTYTTQGEILDSVRGLRHRGGRPLNTGAALQYLSDNVFTVSAGSRRLEGVTQVLILLSGGRSADNVDAQAAALKQLGVLTFAIGTRNSDSKELQKIAHSPTYALSVSEFNDLPSVRNSQVYFKGSQLLFSCLFSVDTAKKDIVFLLDGSDGTRNGFPAMLDFVERVVEKLNVGENKDRVSVVQYSIDAEAHFYLNTYTTKDDIVGSVRGLRHRGGRAPNTGAALQYVRDNVLTSSAGSRHLQGVPQILILLNGGRSSDNVDTPASTLKQLGVLTFAIGTRGSDSAELQRLSSDPSHALSVSDFTDLPSVQEQLSSVMSRVLVRSTPRTPTVTGKKQAPGRSSTGPNIAKWWKVCGQCGCPSRCSQTTGCLDLCNWNKGL